MPRIVSLPWYDLPSTHGAMDGFWSTLRAELLKSGVDRLPDTLNRSAPTGEQWGNSDLLISQCCGPDLFGPAADNLVPVCRPVFSNLNCEAGNYFSHIVSATKVTETPGLAVNSISSHSGYFALLDWLSGRGMTAGKIIISGSHQASIQLIREGQADLAAIDAHSWSFLDHRGVNILDQSADAPSPPFVSGRQSSVFHPAIIAAMQAAVSERGISIGIKRVIPCGIETYRPMGRKN